MTHDLMSQLDAAARSTGFSGVVRIDHPDGESESRAYGWADRARGQAMTVDHRCGLASISKGFTALAVGALVDDGLLSLDSPVRPVLGDDLPLVDDAVTVGQLLSHTAGIGDYIDESAGGDINDYVVDRPLHLLGTTEAFVPLLDGRPQVSPPGSAFAYCNSGFVVLALVAERVSSQAFHDLVEQRVLGPARVVSTGYPRTDEISGDTALGYLEETGDRTNALHLPVRGNGDGGAVGTVADLAAFWSALFAGRIVTLPTLQTLTEPVSHVEGDHMRYARGFWRGWSSQTVLLEGYDAGVSGRTWHDPESGVTGSVLANTSNGAWPVLEALSWA